MNYFLTLGVILFVYMNLWFVISLIKKRNDIADIAWGLGFVLLAWISLFISENFGIKNIIVNILITIWGVRLAWHIHTRNKKKTEDYRYLAWRKEWGKYFYIRSYFQVYILQGLLLFVIASGFLFINKFITSSFNILDFIGIFIWIVGFLFESIGDSQLKYFLQNPTNKGKIITTGLWKYTRHPNYFGEVVLWWGIWFLSLSTSYGLISLISPITITFLILKVSGIPMLEKKYEGRKDFETYKQKTNSFFPWFSKK